MRFRITRASKMDKYPVPVETVGQDVWNVPITDIEIATVEDLVALSIKHGCPIVITMPGNDLIGYDALAAKPATAEGFLTIYDDYLE